MKVNRIDGRYLEGEYGHELFQVSQKVVLFHPLEKKILLLKIANLETEFVQKYGTWDIPGGRINVGEDLEIALRREILEEIGESAVIDLDTSDIAGMFLAEYHEKRVLNVGYFGILTSIENITLSREHSDHRWVTAEEVLQNDEYGPIIKLFVANAEKRMKERSYLNDVKRISADFENYKRRQKDREKELASFLTENVLVDIIPVLDNFHTATAHIPEESKESAWVTGIAYIGKQLEEALASQGLSIYTVESGEQFNPLLHEAVGREGEEATEESGTKIVKTLQRGYRIGDRVIRPAKVMTN